MTLRFFRRKGSATATTDDVPSDGAAATGSGRPSRRSRGSSRSKSGDSRKASGPAAAAATPDPPKRSSTSRTRGRRGGSSRKPATAKSSEKTETAAVAGPAARSDYDSSLEAVLTRQSTVMEQLSEQQLAVMKGLQGSLSAIENRLAGIGGVPRSSERPRAAIFVDVPNVMYAAERMRVKLDYGKLMEFLSRDTELVRASAYAPISDDPEANLDTQKFVEPFVGLGYRIVTKPLKRYADGSVKANFDVELAIDVLTMSDRLDIVILVSGDSDFRRLVELVQSKGVRVEVVSFIQSVSVELRAVADDYIDLNDHLKELKKST